jgi:co-chaperonin GroES (HSP10)
MALNIKTIETNDIRAVGNRVLVTDMHFGEQTTKSGLIIANDDGKTRGIYPRWCRVFRKGPDNKDPYEIGDWILVEHGRWTRSMNISINGNDEIEIRMVEAESILAYSDEKPDSVQMGAEYADGEHATVDPSAFMGQQF